MRVHIYPDPVLLRPSQPVVSFDDELRAKLVEMYETMYAQKGVGLAAPQVGWPVRLLVFNPTAAADDADDALTVINPRIVKKWGRSRDQEGCLSFPDIFVDITRPAGVRLAWQDEQGEHQEEDFNDFPARIVQHEMDHLEGVLLVHRMSPVDRIRFRRELEELQAAATR